MTRALSEIADSVWESNVYVVGGRLFEIRTNKTMILDWAISALAKSKRAPSTPKHIIYVFDHVELQKLKCWDTTCVEPSGEIRCQSSPAQVALVDGASRMISFSDSESRISAIFMESQPSLSGWTRHAPLRNIFMHQLLASGVVMMHGAHLTSSSSHQGVFLFGPSGMGKSTAVSRGIAAGFETLGDDYIAITPSIDERRSFDAYPVYKTLKLEKLSPGHAWAMENLQLLTSVTGKDIFSIESHMASMGSVDSLLTFRTERTVRSSFVDLFESTVQQAPFGNKEILEMSSQLWKALPQQQLARDSMPEDLLRTILET